MNSLPRTTLHRLLVGVIASVCVVLAGPASAAAIIGGKPISIHRAPWIASLSYHPLNNAREAHYCGGAVIAPRVIITAAHCIILAFHTRHDAVVGRSQLEEEGGERVAVTRELAYPGFSINKETGSDIGLIFLAHAVSTPELTIASPKFRVRRGASLLTAGWGVTAETSERTPNGLRGALVQNFGSATCLHAYPKNEYEATNDLCAAGAAAVGVCAGDSGGPLVAHQHGEDVLVGITSWTGDPSLPEEDSACASAKWPGVYARVSRVVRWIHEHAPEAQFSS